MVKTFSFIAAVYLLTYLILHWRGKRGVSLAPLSIGALGILYQVIINRHEPVTVVGLNFATPAAYLWGVLSVCIVLGLGAGLGFLTGKLAIQKEETKHSPWKIARTVFVLFIQTAFIAIFTEELVFRGLIQRELASFISPVAAILIASASFGIWHILVAPYIGIKGWKIARYAINAALVGAIFGIFYQTSHSLLVPSLLHGLWNALVYVFWGLGDVIPATFKSRDETYTHPEYGLIGTGVSLAAVAILLLALS